MSNNTEKRWIINYPEPQLQCYLSRELQISTTMAGLLINRGIVTAEDARRFFNCNLKDLSNSWIIKGIEKAVERILNAQKKSEKVIIFGDYDVDGVTATSLLLEALEELQINVDYYIPQRLEEGYGLNIKAIEEINNMGIDLIITVDCGITSVDEVDYAKKCGIDVIITDHHQPSVNIPDAVSVINPKLEDESLYYNLAGVGVAFKLALALWERGNINNKDPYEQFLDIVALGTIADIVPLKDDNRILTKHGIEKLSNTKRIGIKNLIEVSELNQEKISHRDVAFGLAPRINAAGRIGDASCAVELLTTDSVQRASELSKLLQRENQKRQVIEKSILEETKLLIEKDFDFSKDKIIVLASNTWHSGVIGIVASKIVEMYYKPVILISIEGDIGKGSARSIPDFDIFEALKASSQHLIQCGGHQMAAGLSVEPSKISCFKKSINDYARKYLNDDILIPLIKLDGEVFFNELNYDFLRQLNMMAPFGEGNHSPLLAYKGARIKDYKPVGKDKNHLKMRIESEGKVFDSIGFDLFSEAELAAANEVDLAFNLEENTWQGKTSLQLKLKDFKTKGNNNLFSNISYEDFTQNQTFHNLFDGNNYLVQGSSKDSLDIAFSFIKKVLDGNKVLILGSMPSIVGSLFSELNKILLEFNIKNFYIKPSYTDEQIRNLKKTFETSPGILCADIYIADIYKELYDLFDYIFIVGVEYSQKYLDKNEISVETVKDKPVIVNYIYDGEDTVIPDNYIYKKITEVNKSEYNIFVNDLERILSNNTRTVLYCTTKSELMDINKKIQQKDKHAVIYHPWMSYYQKKLVIEKFNTGLVDFIISITTLNLDFLNDYDQIYFYSLPFDNAHFLYLMGRENNINKINVSPEAFENTKNIIEAIFPSRNTLLHINKYFNNNSSNIKDCIKYLKVNGCLKANLETIKIAKGIFQELQLDKLKNGSKTDLKNSWRYRIADKQRREYQFFFDRVNKYCNLRNG